MPIRIQSEEEPIPGYRLICRLGGGGYGDVWKCEAPGGLHKAIKFVFGSLEPSESILGDDDDSGRAEQELKSLERIKRIRHPFILALDRYEVIEGQLMIVSELADCSLHDRLKECQKRGIPGIPREELLNYMLETAEALDYMTSKHDLLHLDIKPQNLFLLCNHIKIGDFGLVKDVEGKLANVTGGFTAVYSAPESFEGFVTRFSDQYSLAIVYQELLTGQRPFSGQNPKQLLLQHLQGTPNLDPLPAMDRKIIERALAKSPADRWPSSMAMVEALADAFDEDYDTPTTLALQRDSETQVPFVLVPAKPPVTVPLKPDAERVPLPPIPNQPTDVLSKLRSAHLSELDLPAANTSTGVLRPTIIIGLGKMGRVVVQHLQQQMQEEWGTPSFPLLQLLCIDTDSTFPDQSLIDRKYPEDLLPMPLSRPVRYVRTRDRLPPVEEWLDTNLLYRMPRNLVTNGIRALGRLAFIEHHDVLVTGLERALKHVLTPEAEQAAIELTKLEVRSKEPIVYVVAHLGGGTGSGMFIDCAYLARSVLKKQECGGEVGCILLTPELLDGQSPDLPEANAVAALQELEYFQQGGTSYQVRFDTKSEVISDSAQPFSHCLLVELPVRPVKLPPQHMDPASPVLSRLARSLINIMMHPLGQTSDPSWLSRSSSAVYQTLSTQVVTSSRQSILQQASATICNQVIDHWLKPLPPEQASGVHQWMNDFIKQQELSSSTLTAKLDQAVEQELGMSATEYAKQLLAPLSKPVKEYLPTDKEIDKALHNILDLLGSAKTDDTISVSMIDPSTKVTRQLRTVVDDFVSRVSSDLKTKLMKLVDKPNWRLGAADEALLYITRVLEKSAEHNNEQGILCQKQFALAVARLKLDLGEYERMRSTTKFLWPKIATPGMHLNEVFSKRYQALMHERLVSLYSGIAARCAGIAQDLRQCRRRLLDLRQSGRRQDELWNQEANTWNTSLTPPGFSDNFQVVQQLSDSISAEDMQTIDKRIADKLAPDYPSLAETILAAGETLRPLRKNIQEVVNQFLDAQTPQHDVLSLLLEECPNVCHAVEQLHKEAQLPIFFHQATKSFELVFLSLPDSEQSARLEKEIHHFFPDLVTVRSGTDNEVILHRAILGIDLHELSVMSEAGLAAFHTAMEIENFSPHARQDITSWNAVPELALS
jgi:serine/threonine protein kinase